MKHAAWMAVQIGVILLVLTVVAYGVVLELARPFGYRRRA